MATQGEKRKREVQSAKGRDYTVSLAVPGSIASHPQRKYTFHVYEISFAVRNERHVTQAS